MAPVPGCDGGVFCGGEDVLNHFFCDCGCVVEFFEFHFCGFLSCFGSYGCEYSAVEACVYVCW